MIDYRSDTVTKPTSAMVKAMNEAPLGDDVLQDDPSVKYLEAKAAELFGMEAALFAPSGTMTNQIAIKVHTQPGDEVICDQLAHIYNYEGGGIAFNSGCSVKLLNGDKGRFTADMVRDAIQPDDPHHPVSSLVCIENTSNKGGGVIWDKRQVELIGEVCKKNGLAYHMDGARLFNALAETGESTSALGRQFDSISICLSKGLGCPVGSLLVGNAEFIKKGKRVRKVFGGGMRQAGLLAAAGTYALDNHIQRLKVDHFHARMLGDHLSKVDWVDHVMQVETNIVVAVLRSPNLRDATLDALKSKGILAMGFGPGKIRFVTHLDVTEPSIHQTIQILSEKLV